MAKICPMCRAGNLEKLPYRLQKKFVRYKYVCQIEGEACTKCREVLLGHDSLMPAEVAIAQCITHGDERSGKAFKFCRPVVGLSRQELALKFDSYPEVFREFEIGIRQIPESVWLYLMGKIHDCYSALTIKPEVAVHPLF